MYDYEKLYKEQSVDSNSDPRRFSRISSLCRGKVLDVGCNFGTLSDYFFGDYTGLDFSKEALKKAENVRREDASFVLRDCSDLTDFDFSNYDTIVITEFLEHFKNDDKILGPIFDNFKPGTRIIVTCPNGPRIPDPSHERELTIPQLRKRFSPYGKVKFYDWPGAFHQILMTCDLGEKNDDLLSLVMVVKDEGKCLERAVRSCLDFVDNIVISVDSKSTDNTTEIASLYADTLKTHVFDDDFSKMRNSAHEGVKTKWNLFLDGHEHVTKSDNLEKYLALSCDGLLVPVKLDGGMVFHNPRFYKNGVQFEGKIHEKQIFKNVQYYPEFLVEHGRLGVQDSAAILARKEQHDDMVPRILGAEFKKHPENLRASFHLAIFYQAAKDYKKSLFYYRKFLKYSTNSQERWYVLFQICLARCVLGHYFRAFWAACDAEIEMPGRWETQKLKGLVFFQQKKYAKALPLFVDSFKSNTVNAMYKPWDRDISPTWNLIGECFFNLYDFDKANIAFDRAADMCKDKDGKKFLEKRAALMREMFKASFKK